MRRLANLFAAVLLVAAGCNGETPIADEPISRAEGAASPVAAVEELVEAINAGDFAGASRFAVPGQAGLAALAEGATFGEVASALRDGDEEIASHFWAGFAQGAGGFLSGNVAAAEEGTLEEGDVVLHQVLVSTANEGERQLLTRDIAGHRVDLFASFGAGLADKMIPAVERLLETQTDDARLILVRLQEVVPSLLVAARLPGVTGGVSQQILALVELITRVA
jgi:hypothetical protein